MLRSDLTADRIDASLHRSDVFFAVIGGPVLEQHICRVAEGADDPVSWLIAQSIAVGQISIMTQIKLSDEIERLGQMADHRGERVCDGT